MPSNLEAANKRCTFENVFVVTLKVLLIYNLLDTPVFNIWSIINARFDLSEDSPEWKIYEITSLVTYDLLAMMNTLSFFIIFYQIFSISEKIANALGLNSEDLFLDDKGNKDFRVQLMSMKHKKSK